MPDFLLAVEELSVRYGARKWALHHFCLSLDAGRTVGLMGASGKFGVRYPTKTGRCVEVSSAGLLGGLFAVGVRQRSVDPEARGYSVIYAPPIGSALGAAVGMNFHRHGSVLYRK